MRNPLLLSSMMSLKYEEFDALRSRAYLFREHRMPIEAACVDAFIYAFGRQVEVVKGRKVAKGTKGKCVYMEYKPYGCPDKDEVINFIRIGIEDSSGAMHWTYLKNIKLLPQQGVIVDPKYPMWMYPQEERVPYYLMNSKELAETQEGQNALLKLEALVAEYDSRREENARLRHEWHEAQKRFDRESKEYRDAFFAFDLFNTKTLQIQHEIVDQISVCNRFRS